MISDTYTVTFYFHNERAPLWSGTATSLRAAKRLITATITDDSFENLAAVYAPSGKRVYLQGGPTGAPSNL